MGLKFCLSRNFQQNLWAVTINVSILYSTTNNLYLWWSEKPDYSFIQSTNIVWRLTMHRSCASGWDNRDTHSPHRKVGPSPGEEKDI